MSPKEKRPTRVTGTTYMVGTGCGKLFATLNEHKDEPFEVFLKLGSQGSCVSSFMAAIGTLLSVSLRFGVPMSNFATTLAAASCPAHKDGAPSCMSALGLLITELAGQSPIPKVSGGPLNGSLHDSPTGCGNVAVGCFAKDCSLKRVTVEIGAAGSCAAAIGSTIARVINISLAAGVGSESIAKALKGIHCPKSIPGGSTSCLDAVGNLIHL